MLHNGVQYGREKLVFLDTLSLCWVKPYIHTLSRYSGVQNGLKARNLDAILELGGR